MCTLSQEPFQNKGFKDLSHTVPSVNENKSSAGSGVLQKKKRFMFMMYFCGRQVHWGIVNFTYR